MNINLPASQLGEYTLLNIFHAINILRSSIEVVKNGIYSEESDVWAFGMLMWQTFTLMDINKKRKKFVPCPSLMIFCPINRSVFVSTACVVWSEHVGI